MALTNSQKMLILVVLLLILGYFIYNSCDSFKSVEKFAGNASSSTGSPYSNKDTMSMDSTMTSNSSMSSGSNASSMSSGSNASSMSYDSDESSVSTASDATEPDYTMNVQTNASVVPSAETMDIRRGKNANNTKSYKSMNYKDAPRGGSGDLDKFFMDGNVENTGNNTQFSAADNVSDKYAAYQTAKNGVGKSDEGLLPVEEKDWFEDVTPTKIKNRHLINIYRPVGVNTISSSLKNPSLDLRGTPANAKTVVSPFLNSSIEPDHNIRGLCM
jgi:cytoskeletal protein RodZ